MKTLYRTPQIYCQTVFNALIICFIVYCYLFALLTLTKRRLLRCFLGITFWGCVACNGPNVFLSNKEKFIRRGLILRYYDAPYSFIFESDQATQKLCKVDKRMHNRMAWDLGLAEVWSFLKVFRLGAVWSGESLFNSFFHILWNEGKMWISESYNYSFH